MTISENTSRFRGAEWFETVSKLSIAIAGLGTIGSWTSLLVSRLHPAMLYLIDFDTIEASNLGGQFYPKTYVGESKINATNKLITIFSDYYAGRTFDNRLEVFYLNNKDILITGFDSMEARKKAWDKFKDSNVPYLIDGRMSAEGFQILTVDRSIDKDVSNYEKNWLYDSSEVTTDNICSYKATSHIGTMIASYITNLVTNIATNITTPEKRSVPFYIEYDATNFNLIINE